MISLIERGESSPTAVVLEKIATGLDVPARLAVRRAGRRTSPIARRTSSRWRDPSPATCAATCRQRFGSPIQIVEVSFPPGARVAYETGAREPCIHQQVWVLEGAIVVTVGDETHRLRAGDCLALRARSSDHVPQQHEATRATPS